MIHASDYKTGVIISSVAAGMNNNYIFRALLSIQIKQTDMDLVALSHGVHSFAFSAVRYLVLNTR